MPTILPTHSFESIHFVTPMIASLNFLKVPPWSGLVRQSATISLVPQNAISTSPESTLSFCKVTFQGGFRKAVITLGLSLERRQAWEERPVLLLLSRVIYERPRAPRAIEPIGRDCTWKAMALSELLNPHWNVTGVIPLGGDETKSRVLWELFCPYFTVANAIALVVFLIDNRLFTSLFVPKSYVANICRDISFFVPQITPEM